MIRAFCFQSCRNNFLLWYNQKVIHECLEKDWEEEDSTDAAWCYRWAVEDTTYLAKSSRIKGREESEGGRSGLPKTIDFWGVARDDKGKKLTLEVISWSSCEEKLRRTEFFWYHNRCNQQGCWNLSHQIWGRSCRGTFAWGNRSNFSRTLGSAGLLSLGVV